MMILACWMTRNGRALWLAQRGSESEVVPSPGAARRLRRGIFPSMYPETSDETARHHRQTRECE